MTDELTDAEKRLDGIGSYDLAIAELRKETLLSKAVQIGDATLYCGDCLEYLPLLGNVDAVVTDPPYGMGKGEWDSAIPNWLPLVKTIPTVCFSGVVGQHDYPKPDWVGAWVRLASTQRCGKYRGFNNWEPLLFFNISSIDNDVISAANIHENVGHPTVKPVKVMERLVSKMPAGTVLDPFMGSGTTGVACAKLGRKFIGIELEPRYFDIACKRIEEAYRQPDMFIEPPVKAVQGDLI